MKNIVLLSLIILTIGCESKSEFEAVEPVKAPEESTAKTTGTITPPTQTPSELPKNGGVVAPKVGQTVSYANPSEYGTVGPLRWTTPGTWVGTKPASQMRAAEYAIAGKDGAAPVSVSVFHFGPTQGGDVATNVDRWVGQFSTADGKPVGDAAKKAELTVDGMKVHTVDASGTYNPGMAGGNRPPKPDQRMLGAIVETTSGRFFFKMVGPKAGVDAEEKNFEAFVQSLKKG